ncbi:hypothetical protein ACWGNN_00735 [Streptomyces sp. NPDC055817]
MTSTSTPLADPVMEGTCFGIAVSYYGEDSRMIALGHQSKRRALAAFNRHARTFIGFCNVADERTADAAYWADAIEQRWAIFTAPDSADAHEYADDCWFVEFTDGEKPGALPVTVLIP